MNLIEDDVYRELWLDENPPIPIKAFDNNGLVLYLGSLSKSLSPGWIVGPEPVVEHLADIKMQTDYGSSSISQWVEKALFSSRLYNKHLNEVRTELRTRRDFTLNTLNKYFSDIAVWEKPTGGFYIWLRRGLKTFSQCADNIISLIFFIHKLRNVSRVISQATAT